MSNPYLQFTGAQPFLGAGGPAGPTGGFRVSGDVPNIGGGPFNYAVASREIANAPTVHGHAMSLANTFIQYSYTMVPWGDGREEQIMEYQLVFAAKHIDKRHNLSAIVTIGQLNCIIRDAHNKYQQGKFINLDDKTKLDAFLNNVNIGNHNELLEAYDAATPVLRGKLQDMVNAMNRAAGGGDIDLAAVYAIAQKDILLYQTAFGIKKRWNFLGVSLSKMQATSLNSISLDASSEHVHVLNVILGERARVHNYWGTKKDTWNGSRVHLYLSKKSNSADAPFQWYTYASRENRMIPDDVLYEKEAYNGNRGVITRFVGTITEHSETDPHEGARQQALGATNEQSAYESVARLPFLWIQLGI